MSFIQPTMRPESSGPTMILAWPAKRSSSSPENLAAMPGRTEGRILLALPVEAGLAHGILDLVGLSWPPATEACTSNAIGVDGQDVGIDGVGGDI